MGDLVSTAIQVVLAVATASYGRRKRKKQERKFRERAAGTLINVRPTGSGEAIPIVYGYTPVSPIQVYAQTGASYGISGPTDKGDFGTMFAPRQGDPNQFLMVQAVLSVGELSEVQQLWLDDRNVDTTNLTGDVRAHWSYSAASVFATSFNATERPDSARFTDLSYITIMMDVNWRDPKFSGIPQILTFCRGVRTHDITATGLSDTKTDTVGAVRVLLDYLTADDYGPPSITVDDIDFPSWHAANQIATAVVQGESNALWPETYPDELNTRSGTSYDNWFEGFEDAGFDDIDDAGATESTNWGTHNEALCRYDFNGLIYPSDPYPNVVDSILSVMPGAILFRSLNGKWKLSLPDSMSSAADQSVGTIDGDVLVEPVSVQYPDASTKVNRSSARFINKHKEMAADELTFPTVDSAFDRQLRARDNQIELHETRTLEGVTDRYHATSILASELLTSGRPRFIFKTGLEGLNYEPGEVVQLIDPAIGLPSTYVRIIDVKLQPNFTVDFDAIEFLPSDYSWIISDKEELTVQPRRSRVVERPAQVTAQFDADARVMRVTWTASPTVGVETVQYEIQYRRFGAGWRPLAIVYADSEFSVDHIPEFRQSTYTYRVRAISLTGQLSAWRESPNYEADGSISTVDTRTLTAGTTRPADPSDGDLHIDPDGTVQEWNGTEWVSTGVDLTGPATASVILVAEDEILNNMPTVDGSVVGDVAVATTGLVWTWDGTVWVFEGNLRGVDGIGFEFIYAVTDGATPSLPDNTWGYEQPRSPWFDDAPSLTEANNTLWQSRRRVMGAPRVGADVAALWGAPRITGRFGSAGRVIYVEEGEPVSLFGNDGDLYVERVGTAFRGLWRKHEGVWIFVSAHPDGLTWLSGGNDPAPSLGRVGDWYFNTGTSGIWVKTAAVGWEFLVLISGPGKTWLSGSGVPADSLGAQGNCYFQYSNGFSYTKVATGWRFDRDVTGVAVGAAAPGVPDLPRLVSVTQTSISVATAPSLQGGSPTSYEWRYGLEANTPLISFPPVQAPTTLITGLVVNTDYWLSVRAINDAGTSAWSAELMVRTTAVAAAMYNPVETINIQGIRSTSATAVWLPPIGGSHDANNNVVTVQSYVGNIRVVGTGWPPIEDSVGPDQRTFALTGLAPGTQYDYRLRVRYSDGGFSDYDFGRFTTLALPDPVTPVYNRVRGLAVRNIAANSAVASWVGPEDGSHDSGNSPVFVLNYLFSLRMSGGNYAPEVVLSRATLTQTLTGLAPSTPHTFRVRVRYTDGGLSGYRQFTFITLEGAPPAQPVYNRPRNLVVTNIEATAAVADWDAPSPGSHDSANNAVTVVLYVGSIRVPSAPWPDTEASVAAPTTSFRLMGLTPSTQYQYRIRAVYSDGGVSSYLIGSFSTIAAPAPPVGVYNAPGRVQFSNIRSTSARATWAPPASGSRDENGNLVTLQGYRGAIRRQREPWPSQETAVGASVTSLVLTGLSPGVVYDYRIRAVYSNGGLSSYVTGYFSTELILDVVAAVYNPIQNPAISELSNTSATAMWEAPAPGSVDRVNTPVNPVSYLFSLQEGTEGYSDEVLLTIDTTSRVLTPLTPGTDYTFRVRVFYENGAFSDPVEFMFTTLTEVMPMYNPVSDLVLSDVTRDSASLSWTAPLAGSFGSDTTPVDVTNYLFSSREGDEIFGDEISLPDTTLRRDLTGLTASTRYSVRVRVRYSDNGLSDYLIRGFTTQTTSVYNPVASVSATSITHFSALAQWEAPAAGSHDADNNDLTVADYLFSFRQGSEAYRSEVTVAPDTLSNELTQLDAETMYTFRVRVRYSDGGLSDYATFDFTTTEVVVVPAVYNPVNDLSASNISGTNNVAVTWNMPDLGSHGIFNNAVSVVEYRYSVRLDGQLRYSVESFTDQPSATVFSPIERRRYTVRVRVLYSDGEFSDYQTFEFITPSAGVGATDEIDPPVPYAKIIDVGTDRAVMQWGHPDATVARNELGVPDTLRLISTGYRLGAGTSGFGNGMNHGPVAGSRTLEGLNPATVYTGRVNSQWATTLFGISQNLEFRTRPSSGAMYNPPQNLTVTFGAEARIDWDAPAPGSVDASGNAVSVTGYTYSYRHLMDTTRWPAFDTEVGADVLSVTERLRSGFFPASGSSLYSYNLRVRAMYSDGGFSDYAPFSFQNVPLNPISLPPASPQATDLTSTSATLAWGAPSRDIATPVPSRDGSGRALTLTGYRVQVRTDRTIWPEMDTGTETGADVLSLALTALSPSTNYIVRVKALYASPTEDPARDSDYVVVTFTTPA